MYVALSTILLVSFAEFALAVKKEATIRVRLTSNGLHFFSDIAHHILDYEVQGIQFPSISIPISGGSLGSGTVNVSDLRIQSFKSPNIKFKLIPRNGIGWKSNGGAVKVYGNWKASYTLVIPIYMSGYVRASANDIRTLLQTEFDVAKLRPQLNIDACSMDVENIDVSIGGGIIPWIVNLFRPELSALIKEEIRSQFCTTLETVLLQEANEALLSLPTRIQVANNLYVNYRCERKPLATKDFIEAEVYSDIVYGNTTCDLPVARMDRDVDSLNYMVDFWVSQHIPNCLLHSAHKSGLLNFVVDKDFDGGKLKSFLSTSCSLLSPCIGRLFPKLREEYPNEYVDFRFVTAQRPPLINVAPNGVRATASMFLDSFISPWTNQTSRLFRLGTNITIDMVPLIMNNSLTARVENVTVQLSEIDSRIGHFSERIIMILKTLLIDIIKVFAQSLLHVGVPLPVVDNVTLANDAYIVTKTGFVRISSDFIYEHSIP